MPEEISTYDNIVLNLLDKFDTRDQAQSQDKFNSRIGFSAPET